MVEAAPTVSVDRAKPFAAGVTELGSNVPDKPAGKDGTDRETGELKLFREETVIA